MEPLRGGKIATKHPKAVQDEIDSLERKCTNAEWALRWVWNNPRVITVLSGMSNMEQLKENISVAKSVEVGEFNDVEIEAFKRIKEIYFSNIQVHCTDCKYCMPCPVGVNIPYIFRFYNELYMYGDEKESKRQYNYFMKEEQKGHNCIKCGKCEKHCPQNIQIIEHLEKAGRVLDE